MVFVDEAGVNLGMARRYGWSGRGRRLVMPAPFCRGKNVSVIGAICSLGMITELAVQGSVDEDILNVFLKDYLLPELKQGQVIIMDNVRFHKCKKIEQVIVDAGFSVIFLPPYCPDLNPMENAWSKVKECMRSAAARTYDALIGAIRDAALSITGKDSLGWFAHCGYFKSV